ncbi:uncharacterized protein LOC9632366 [Selaginella moellendorffii]|nr:uncharacterized protein LOC9632366 [Selaginella moellendorffii]|eukprot:XP_002991558.2 uncharacterized protein LOC9632366 [Selaginella moellendorffii]
MACRASACCIGHNAWDFSARNSKRRGAMALRCSASGNDQILRCVSKNAEVSVLSIVGKHLVQEAQRRHQTSPTASAALGRALLGTLLVASLKDDAETVQISFLGRGPLGQMTTVASQSKLVKGFVSNPLCDLPLTPQGKLDVGTAVGAGALNVVRNHPRWKQPYTGSTPIYSGEVAEDIARYLAESEQINTALGIGVAFSTQGTVKAARGYLVQALPFCSEETLTRLEKNVASMHSLSDPSLDMTAREMITRLLEGIGTDSFSDPVFPEFGPCGVDDLKPRMIRAVASLGASDVRELLSENGYVEVKCEFCAETVRFVEEDLKEIFTHS